MLRSFRFRCTSPVTLAVWLLPFAESASLVQVFGVGIDMIDARWMDEDHYDDVEPEPYGLDVDSDADREPEFADCDDYFDHVWDRMNRAPGAYPRTEARSAANSAATGTSQQQQQQQEQPEVGPSSPTAGISGGASLQMTTAAASGSNAAAAAEQQGESS